jgi:hypothetical protein
MRESGAQVKGSRWRIVDGDLKDHARGAATGGGSHGTFEKPTAEPGGARIREYAKAQQLGLVRDDTREARSNWHDLAVGAARGEMREAAAVLKQIANGALVPRRSAHCLAQETGHDGRVEGAGRND